MVRADMQIFPKENGATLPIYLGIKSTTATNDLFVPIE